MRELKLIIKQKTRIFFFYFWENERTSHYRGGEGKLSNVEILIIKKDIFSVNELWC